MKDNEILQELYDKGMIDFEGDEDGLTMQVPTNIIKTGQFVVDVYKVGYEKGKENIIEVLKVVEDIENRIKLCLKSTKKDKEKGMPPEMDWKAEALGYKTSLECIKRTREKFALEIQGEKK